MKRRLFFKLAVLTAFCFIFSAAVYAQETRPFWNEVQEFKHRDSLKMPRRNGIVFYGSSSIRKWNDAETIFQDYKVINRGFGGSTLVQAAAYADELVIRYHPRQVVIYCGDNDIAQDKISAEETLNRLKVLVEKIKNALPEVQIVYLSIKQSPSRAEFSATILKANALIKAYLETLKNTAYLDVNSKMLDANANPRPELFESDMLHLKPAGYAIWEKELRPLLLKPRESNKNQTP